ncbi:pentapeptide repeat family protein [Calothrix brevissima NIES-22]|nr:pentapeptide repeat family protein [Calothrix brevissima NIES-22]
MQSQSQNFKITPEFFIHPNVDLDTGDDELLTIVNLTKEQLKNRWLTSAGQHILTRWRANGYKRHILDEMVGRYYGHTDIRGIPLVGEDLSRVDLSKIDFFSSNLENVNLKSANLTDSWLSESNIKGTCFDYARMNDVLIDKVEFNKKTSFTGVSLKVIDFNLSAMLQEYATNQQKIDNLKTNHPWIAKALEITCDYGRSFSRFFICCLTIVAVFGMLYASFPEALNKPGLWNGLYFSVMTFTSAGSEIQALSTMGKILASTEAFLGYLMLSLLVAILVRRTIGD